MKQDGRWTISSELNLLTPENLALAQTALERGWLSGMHYYYAGGCSGDAVVFTDYAEYVALVQSARPGDLFILWSVSLLRERRELLMEACFDPASSTTQTRQGGLDEVLKYVQTPNNEILAVGADAVSPPSGLVTAYECSDWESFLAMVERTRQPGGLIYVLPFTSLDRSENDFLHGKRPNAQGEDPLGGAY